MWVAMSSLSMLHMRYLALIKGDVVLGPERAMAWSTGDGTAHDAVHGLVGLMGVGPASLEMVLEVIPGGQPSHWLGLYERLDLLVVLCLGCPP